MAFGPVELLLFALILVGLGFLIRAIVRHIRR